MITVAMVGVPSSAASYAAGQDQAPRALREAGLVPALAAAGVEVHDAGDLTEQIWAPDGMVAGLSVARGDQAGGDRCGLLYLDRHFDLNTPATTIDGALDWMGVAHGLDLPGSRDELAGAFPVRPVLEPDRLVFLGVDPTQATDFEREQVAALGISVTTQSEVVADPAGAAATALRALPAAPFAAHVDVDVLDFIDAPLAENTSGRNIGPTVDQLGAALAVIVADPRWRGLSVGEINPTRAAGDPGVLTRFTGMLASALAQAGSGR